MPYIKPQARTRLEPAIRLLIDALGDSGFVSGELNYTICRLVQAGKLLDRAPAYQAFEEALGVLEAVKLELYRKAVAPYEDAKEAQNGKVL